MNPTNKDLFANHNHLGFQTPYYFLNDTGKFVIKENIAQTLSVFKPSRQIDALAVIEFLNKNYILGNRTLIKGISKTPWMAKPNIQLDNWVYANTPAHSEIVLSEQDIANKLFNLISEEIVAYTQGKNNIGILLSGGLDSRILAGTLDFLMKNRVIPKKNICALTWGDINSRDVVYAKLIAAKLKWEWKHYVVSSEHLKQNIEETAILGCEYSPVHLHAIPQIRDDNNLDCIIAASYGDSIGRGEYSGQKILELKAIDSDFKNTSCIFKSAAYNENYGKWQSDLSLYHNLFPQKEPYQQIEQDYQIHYMRRNLNPCMDMINEKMPFYQLFTKPTVFGFIWSINPKLRTDRIYSILFSFLNRDLRNIPWARTGFVYGEEKGMPDEFEKDHHSYKKQILYDIYDHIHDLIFNGNIEKLDFFNFRSITSLFKVIKKYPYKNFDYLEKIIWIASLSRMVEIYKLEFDNHLPANFNDKLRGRIITQTEYMSRISYREIKNILH